MASTISLTVGMDLADISDESAFEADDDDDDRPINLLVNDSFVSTNQWSTLVNEQPVAGLTADNFGARTAVGDVFAFEDKCFSESTTWRSIFVVRVEDGVVIFDEDGEELDEPEHGTPEGQQSLSDFVDDWKDGYYAVGEGVELQPPGGETAIVAVETMRSCSRMLIIWKSTACTCSRPMPLQSPMQPPLMWRITSSKLKMPRRPCLRTSSSVCSRGGGGSPCAGASP